jgi:phosphoserine / homoserine phosphotransferase
MHIVCTDLEGVLVPEIWINVAAKTGIKELKLTTRDISDYDVLMKKRLAILDKHGISLADIQAVIATMEPLDGALDYLNWLRERVQVMVVSDTFVEFARPLMAKLGWPTILCHSLSVDEKGMVSNYNLRQKDSKRQVILALKKLKYEIISIGDSYNDTTMLSEAQHGILFCPPENVEAEFPQYPVTRSYRQAMALIGQIIEAGA